MNESMKMDVIYMGCEIWMMMMMMMEITLNNYDSTVQYVREFNAGFFSPLSGYGEHSN